jgi:type II secretory pathway pseudopilin PulG
MSAGKDRGLTPNSQKGFTYFALLLAVAVTGAALAAFGELSSHASQRERESELLFVGDEIRHAIGAFYERSPGGAKRYPAALEELLEDKRHPVPQRHLRRIYPDPLTGVYSRSELAPIRRGNFSKADESFAQATRYSDWKFFHSPQELPVQK